MKTRQRKQPTIGDSFEIDIEAVELMKNKLPKKWPWRDQRPDIFVDAEIEVSDDGEPTGRHFGLQIKGTRHAKIRGNSIRHRIERKALAYYRDKARLPIFIALVDVTSGKAYWIFAQKYLRERANEAQLYNQSTLTLRFEREDSFSDLERFKNALTESEIYMRNLYPGSVAAAASDRKKALEALDPRVKVDVSFESGVTTIKLRPTEPLPIQFRPTEPDKRTAFQALLSHGEVFETNAEVIPPFSSPIFGEMFPDHHARIRFEPETKAGCVRISWGDASARVMQVDGRWRGGTESLSFSGSLSNAPLSIKVRVAHSSNSSPPDVRTNIRFDLGTWTGQPLNGMAWFDDTRALIAALASREEVMFRLFVEGVDAGAGAIVPGVRKNAEQLHSFVDWIARCRALATRYGVAASMPDLRTVTYQQERELDALWAVSEGNSLFDSIAGQVMSFSADPKIPIPKDWESKTVSKIGTLSLIGRVCFDLFGHSIELDEVENIFSGVELIGIETDATSRRLTFRGRDNAVWLRRKARDRNGRSRPPSENPL
jgi:hypothetical protein